MKYEYMKIINLLPKEEQLQIRQEQMFFNVRRIIIISFLSYILVAAILIGARFYMQQSLGSLDNEIKQQQNIISKQDNTVLKNSITLDNQIVQDYNNVSALNPTWSKVLEEFVKLVPSGVEVQTFNASSSDGQIQISGISSTRDAVLRLRANILYDPMFTNINLPLENLQQAANLNYHYDFFVKSNLLQAQPDAKLKLPLAPAKPGSALTPAAAAGQ